MQSLQDRIDRVETSQRTATGQTISSGCAALDRLLPGQGYSPGTLVQWLTEGGYAADYLSLLTGLQACRHGEALVVLDPWRQFYPPAVAALGFDTKSLIILRPEQKGSQAHNDFFWAIDQALRCSAVGAVWGPVGSIDERWFRRFQLSAESSGCLGLFVQSVQEAKQPSWAEVQWLATQAKLAQSKLATQVKLAQSQTKTVSSNERQQRVRLQLTRCRGSRVGQVVEVTVDAITGEVQ